MPLAWGVIGLCLVTLNLATGEFDPLYDSITFATSLGFFVGSAGVIIEKTWGYIILVVFLAIQSMIGVLHYNISMVYINLIILAVVSKSYIGYSPVG